MNPILTRAEQRAEATPRTFPRGVSAEERLMALADAGRRADAALRRFGGDIPADLVALVALAISGDVEGR